MREANKCEILAGASRPDAPANLMGSGRDQRTDFVLHAVALGFRDQSGVKQDLIVVIQPELPGELLLRLLRRRLFLRTDAVRLLFCKYSQRKAESCSSSPFPRYLPLRVRLKRRNMHLDPLVFKQVNKNFLLQRHRRKRTQLSGVGRLRLCFVGSFAIMK